MSGLEIFCLVLGIGLSVFAIVAITWVWAGYTLARVLGYRGTFFQFISEKKQ